MYAAHMNCRVFRMSIARICTGLAAGSLLLSTAGSAASAAPAATRSHAAAAAAAGPGPARKSPYLRAQRSEHAAFYYASTWGVDQLRARRTESGSLIRFSYRVVDASLAKPLHEKKAEPHMIALRTHAVLTVPTMENVGQLRQSESVQNGKNYWVLFSNKGDLVKVGDRVDVVIGDFSVSDLVVE